MYRVVLNKGYFSENHAHREITTNMNSVHQIDSMFELLGSLYVLNDHLIIFFQSVINFFVHFRQIFRQNGQKVRFWPKKAVFWPKNACFLPKNDLKTMPTHQNTLQTHSKHTQTTVTCLEMLQKHQHSLFSPKGWFLTKKRLFYPKTTWRPCQHTKTHQNTAKSAILAPTKRQEVQSYVKTRKNVFAMIRDTYIHHFVTLSALIPLFKLKSTTFLIPRCTVHAHSWIFTCVKIWDFKHASSWCSG